MKREAKLLNSNRVVDHIVGNEPQKYETVYRERKAMSKSKKKIENQLCMTWKAGYLRKL